MILSHSEKRWALAVFPKDGSNSFLLGRFCWPGATKSDVNVRTFRTRKQAREAVKDVCYSEEARPVRVEVRVSQEK